MNNQIPLQIKQATPEDVPLVLSFVRELAEYEKLSDHVSLTEERLHAAMFGPAPCAHSVIAYRDDEAVAFAIYYFSYSSFTGLPNLYLEDIFVRPTARGSGIGRSLFNYLAQKAVERGCGRMEWAVLDWNETAIRFYKNLGAEPVQGWTVFRLSREHLDQMANNV